MGKSALEVAGAMTAQDKITSAMAAPAKLYRKHLKNKMAFVELNPITKSTHT